MALQTSLAREGQPKKGRNGGQTELEALREKAPMQEQPASTVPSARYFQVHFEYLHEMLGELKNKLDDANRQIAVLQRQVQALSSRPQSVPAKKTDH